MPSIGPTNTMNDNSYATKYYFSSMPASNKTQDYSADKAYMNISLFALVIGKSQLTIGSWLKFDTRGGADVGDIGIFHLW